MIWKIISSLFNMTFTELPIIWPLQKALVRLNMTSPTEIQKQVIPVAIEHKDILGLAQTGSWKTLSFTLPILQNLYTQRKDAGYSEWKIDRKIKSLILAPTRELAIQIWETFKPYCTNANMMHTVIYGWVNQFHQEKTISKWIDILIATPGRLLDLVHQEIIDLSNVSILTLDEADKMLNMGFITDIRKILKFIPAQRQTLFFSATMPEKIEVLANEILTKPVKIEVNTNSTTVDTVEQSMYYVEDKNKPALLLKVLNENKFDTVIIFVKTKDRTEEVLYDLQDAGIKCGHIHRNRSQNARQKALKSLKNREIRVLIATDILSRWIDIEAVSCVINYDLPQENETYVHRIGRTARAWKKWISIAFVVDAQREKMNSIIELTGADIKEIKS
jgi:ATP-dependent RNA helicase RhlE